MNDISLVLPNDDDKWLYFHNEDRKERCPFVIYADLETVLEKIEEPANETRTYNYHHHKVFSVGYYLHHAYDAKMSKYRFCRGENCVQWFVNQLNNIAHSLKRIIVASEDMVPLTCEEEERFRTDMVCHVCNKAFEREDLRVRDYNRLTGCYKGAAHSTCNPNYKTWDVIPIFFHNLSDYNAHFIIKDIANGFKGHVELLSTTKEKYISFTKNVTNASCGKRYKCVKLRFVDSYKFLDNNLEQLVPLLNKETFRIMRAEFSELSNDDFKLITRKGVFPYEYVDNVDKLRDTELPSREAFYSSLTGDTISTSDYKHALDVWRLFRVKDLGEYSDLYLKMDILFLADVFEYLRNICIRNYKLDPAHYYTLASYSWDAMLKLTDIKLELLTNSEMVSFVERGIRGGFCQCSSRYAHANNKYMPSFNQSKESSYLMHFKINDLYDWAMMKPLPYGHFQWVDLANFDEMFHGDMLFDSDIGYILEVDLEYPRELHDSHEDLPFCPVYDKPPGKHCNKLLATLCNKQNYVIHYVYLQQCLKNGLRLTKIHRVLQFAQSPWLGEYIEYNAACSIVENNDFNKNLYKLLNNTVFGKTMENVRKYNTRVRLVRHWGGKFGVRALSAKPNFVSRSIFSNNLMAVELRKPKMKLSKPIYLGMSILDISKKLLYSFHYDYMKPLHGANCKIMYTDTGSLVYHVKCNDVYKYMKRNLKRFDTSGYPENNPYHIQQLNKDVAGVVKDINNGSIMTEFVGLKAKTYATRVIGKSDTIKLTGLNRNIVAKEIKFNDYLRCLEDLRAIWIRQFRIRSSLHEVYTVSEFKLALSPEDDKRWIEDFIYDTLPWGHYAVQKRKTSSYRRLTQ